MTRPRDGSGARPAAGTSGGIMNPRAVLGLLRATFTDWREDREDRSLGPVSGPEPQAGSASGR